MSYGTRMTSVEACCLYKEKKGYFIENQMLNDSEV